MPTLYLSTNHATAIAEYMQAIIHPGTLAPYEVVAEALLDLTNASVRLNAGIDEEILKLPWRQLRDVDKCEPESWALARAAFAAGFDGLVVQSTQGPGANLVLWRWNGEGARVDVVDPTGLLTL
jgi:RES domain-containing protein